MLKIFYQKFPVCPRFKWKHSSPMIYYLSLSFCTVLGNTLMRFKGSVLIKLSCRYDPQCGRDISLEETVQNYLVHRKLKQSCILVHVLRDMLDLNFFCSCSVVVPVHCVSLVNRVALSFLKKKLWIEMKNNFLIFSFETIHCNDPFVFRSHFTLSSLFPTLVKVQIFFPLFIYGFNSLTSNFLSQIHIVTFNKTDWSFVAGNTKLMQS